MAHELTDNNDINASWLAEWMYNRGQCVMEYCSQEDMHLVTIGDKTCAFDRGSLRNKGLSYEDIMVGDLVFFAEESNHNRVGGSFRGISHVAVITKAESTFSIEQNEFCYYHEFTEIISNTYAQYSGGTLTDYDGITVVEDFACDTMQTRPLWDNPTPDDDLYTLAWGGSMVMVCRPNLQAASLSNNLKMEAQKMGMHETPANWKALNAVKRAREYTDTKWTPAVDLKRVSPFSDAVFLHGNEYVGIPQIPSDGEEDEGTFHVIGSGHGIDEFVSSVGVEGTFNTNYKPDGTNASVCSGWLNETDIIRYAYNVASQIPFERLLSQFNRSNRFDPTSLDIEIGDVILFYGKNGGDMAAIVSDVVRDVNALIDGRTESVISVELCQTGLVSNDDICNSSEKNGQYGGGLAERRVYSRGELFTMFNQRSFCVAIRNFNCGDLKYEVNPFGGKPGSKHGNLPVVPYNGNKSYYIGDDSDTPVFRVPLVINDTGYDTVELECYWFQDTTDSYSFAIADLEVDENGCVVVEYESSSDDSYKYIHKCVAHLAKTVGDEVYSSAPCEWKGIPTIVLQSGEDNFDVNIETTSYGEEEADLVVRVWTGDYSLSIKAVEFEYGEEPVKPQLVFTDYLSEYDDCYSYSSDEDTGLSINVMGIIPVLPASGTLYLRDEEYGVDVDIPMEFSWIS